ncbi:MAG: polymer-forming cytoskeletal protein [Chitinophagales bacterium]|nr:polymer-forming cytoskeletal protein [Chitinophagales bacterium]
MEGKLDSDGDIRVEGIIRGSIRTSAKVAVGSTGLIEGDIHCKSADIEGRIIGDVEVTEVLTLKSTAIVEGNIYTAKIVIENGAHFDGICNMGTKEKERRITHAQPELEEAAI